MAKQTRIIVIVLGIALVLFFISRQSQKKYIVQTRTVISVERDDIHRFVVQKEDKEIELVRSDTSWAISRHDTLSIKSSNLESFFDDILQLGKESSPISNNPNYWSKYSVDDSTGTHLFLYDSNDEELSHVVLGRTKTNFGKNTIRLGDDPHVYLTDKNILFRLQTRPTYWGEKPKPIEVEPDTSNPVIPTIPLNIPAFGTDTTQR